jgi:hypothetical protein
MLEKEQEKKTIKRYNSNLDIHGHLEIGGQGEFAALHPRMWNERT